MSEGEQKDNERTCCINHFTATRRRAYKLATGSINDLGIELSSGDGFE